MSGRGIAGDVVRVAVVLSCLAFAVAVGDGGKGDGGDEFIPFTGNPRIDLFIAVTEPAAVGSLIGQTIRKSSPSDNDRLLDTIRHQAARDLAAAEPPPSAEADELNARLQTLWNARERFLKILFSEPSPSPRDLESAAAVVEDAWKRSGERFRAFLERLDPERRRLHRRGMFLRMVWYSFEVRLKRLRKARPRKVGGVLVREVKTKPDKPTLVLEFYPPVDGSRMFVSRYPFLDKEWSLQDISDLASYVEKHRRVKLPAEEKTCVDLTNDYRRMMGLPRLAVHPLLVKAARGYSMEMKKGNFFSHVVQRKGVGKTPMDRASRAGYTAWVISENLARGVNLTARRVVELWKRSLYHHRNMLRDLYFDIGCGVVKGAVTKRNGIPCTPSWWTQLFGSGKVNLSSEGR